ncbi:MAG: hypothetical protein ACRD2U_13715 [Terriglobales bacterium]
MYTADVLSRVQALREEIAAIRHMNDRYSEQERPAGLAVRANGDRESRLKEIMLELSGIAKEQHP